MPEYLKIPAATATPPAKWHRTWWCWAMLAASALLSSAVPLSAQAGGADALRDGELALNAGKLQEAYRLFNDAIQLYTEKLNDPSLSTAEKGTTYYERGLAYDDRMRVYRKVSDFNRADADQNSAIADYGKAVQADPKNAQAYLARGNDEDDDEKTIADYTAALDLHTLDAEDTAEAYYNRGDRYNFKQPDKAMADYGSAVKADPQFASAYYARGKLYDQEGHRDLAIADYTSALSLPASTHMPYGTGEFGTGDAYYRRGKDEDQTGRHDLGIADFTAAIGIAPSSGWMDPNDNIGYAYESHAKDEELKHQYQLAIADYTKILDLNPLGPDETAEIYKERGDDYGHIGQQQKAAADHAKYGEIKHDLLCNQEGYEACSMDDKR